MPAAFQLVWSRSPATSCTHNILLVQVAFFEQAAEAAAALNTSVDVWLCADSPRGMAALAPLVTSGAGSVTHYTPEPGCPLPQVLSSAAS